MGTLPTLSFHVYMNQPLHWGRGVDASVFSSGLIIPGEVKYCVAKLFSNNVKLEKEWNDL